MEMKSANHALLDFQFNRVEKNISSELVIIAVDDESLAFYPSWPWPRSIYANVIQKLEKYKVRNVAFDIDFSASSISAEDQIFAQSLNNSKLDIALASYFSQGKQTGEFLEHQPMPILKKNAAITNANVQVDSMGNISLYEAYVQDKWQSIASFLANLDQSTVNSFYIDYSYDWNEIPVFSVKEIMTDQVPAEHLRGKNILIGATAIVLGDTFKVPSNHRIPGVYIHALAYETLIRAQQFKKLSPQYIHLICLLLVVLLAITFNPRKTIRLMIVVCMSFAVIFYTTAYLHMYKYVILESAKIYASVIVVSVLLFAYSFYLKTLSFYREQNQKNYHKAVSRQVIKGNTNGIVVVKDSGEIVVCNKKAKRLFNLKDHDKNLFSSFVEGRELLENSSFLEGDEINYHKLRHHQNVGGQHLDLEVFVNRVFFSTTKFQGIIEQKHELYCFVVIDETEKNKALEDVHRSQIALLDIKFNDALTKLANRYSYDRYLESLLLEKSDDLLTVTLLSIDSLQEINYIYGGFIGDSVICKVSEVLQQEMVRRAKVFKFSSDTFAVVGRNVDKSAAIKEMQRIYFLFTTPLKIQNQQLLISVSLGTVMSPDHGDEVEKLSSCAEAALNYAARARFQSCFYYEETVFIELRKRAALKQELRRAISDKEFVLYYQPQHNLKSGQLVGLEGLLRWNDPIKGLRYPDEFIGAVEDFGLMGELGQLVIDMGCQDALRLPEHIKIAVNVSPVQFLETDLVQLCTSSIERSGVQANRLELEITESMLMDDYENASKVLNRIKDLGVSIAMDDFGTGYSSLQYLSKLPFDKLKIDRSFSMNLGHNKQDEDIIVSIIRLGQAANKAILAEGIENHKNADILRENGCDYGQGYLYGRPKPIAHYLE